jgi:photosynthetic reaction center cytochrome c subunit
MTLGMKIAVALVVLVGVLLASRFEHPPIAAVQQGYRGTGMEELDPVSQLERIAAAIPEAYPPAAADGPKAKDVYENVQVLGDLSDEQFTRLMGAITDWVAPEAGCTYCHDDEGNFALDNKYTKVVARRMIQMTRHINTDWTRHVAETGVTCYTCHRGQPVPGFVWFTDPDAKKIRGLVGNRQGQNVPATLAGLTALPTDPLTPYIAGNTNIRVVSQTALPPSGSMGASIKDTEETYSLMMHISQSLGVNCTFCHNTRSFTSWDQSNPPRAVAFQGINMVRDLNANYLGSLQSVLPQNRLSPHGDFPKLDCATCHQGEFKPLLGVSMLKDNPELAVPEEAGIATPRGPEPAASEAPAPEAPAAPTQPAPEPAPAPSPAAPAPAAPPAAPAPAPTP